jgi:hypothetical protein
MPLPIAAAAIGKFAAPLILKGLGKFFGNKGKQKQQKELQRAQQEQIDNRYKSDFDTFENAEDTRLAKTQGIANQLTGARGLSPEVIKAAMARKRNTAYKGAVADMNKGAGTAMLGDALGGIGDIASSMNRESMMNRADQGMSRHLLPSVGGLDVGPDTVDCPKGVPGC